MRSLSTTNTLQRFFAGITENAFMSTLGVADPLLVDYISGILIRFLHNDIIYRLRDLGGQPIHEVIDMVREAEQLPSDGRTRREYHRHIGDFTLFWTGLYPENVQKARSAHSKDYFVSYCAQGKRSYYIASTFEADDCKEEACVLRRLSDQFELCAYGLHFVRKEFETAHHENDGFEMVS